MKHLRVSLLAAWSGLAMLLLVVALAGAHTLPIRADETALSLDCSFRAINVTADVGSSPGVFDMQPGEIGSRVVYFASSASTGVITVSTLVSVTDSPCYLWSSPAFSVTTQGEFTPTTSVPSVSIPYPLSSGHGSTATVALTLSAYYTGSTLSPNQVVTLTFVRDWPSMIYLPSVRRDPQVVNGDFENGWDGWTHGQGAFRGHGSGLPSSIVLFEGSHRALLGSPALDDKNESLPVGYAAMSQTVTVPLGATDLMLAYRVHTFDTVYGTGENKYFDTFEFSVGKAPDQIADTDRESAGCRTSVLNPHDVTLTPSASGLVFCAGGQPADKGGAAWDSGWRSVKVDLASFANTRVTLYFANWNREYDARWFNDKGYYNTYTYVDNVWFTMRP